MFLKGFNLKYSGFPEDPMPFKLFCSSFDPIFFLFRYVRHHLAFLRAKTSKAKKSLGQEMKLKK